MNDIEAELIQALQRDPEDDEARLVYADWLEQRGDLRGEYLRLEVQLHRIPPRLAELAPLVSPRWLAMVGLRYRVVMTRTDTLIMAIKVVRSITGLGLKDAKDLVEQARDTGRAVIREDLDRAAAEALAAQFEGVAGVRIERHMAAPSLHPEAELVVASVREGRRVDAIKRIRELTGWTVAETAAFVDTVLAGTPRAIRLAVEVDEEAALLGRFQDIAEVRVQRDPI